MKLWATLCEAGAKHSIGASAHALDTKGDRAAPPAFDRTFDPPKKNGRLREHRATAQTHRRSASGKGAKLLPHGQVKARAMARTRKKKSGQSQHV